MENKIAIGKILKPHGIKGECVFLSYSGELTTKKYKTYYILINETFLPLTIKVLGSYKNTSDMVRLFIEGYNRDTVEQKLLSKEIFVDELNYNTLEQDEFFYKDIIGARVYKEEEEIGIVGFVHNFGAKDLLEVELTLKEGDTKENIVFLPLQEEFLIEFNSNEKKVIFNREIDGFL